ncbi:hypothetical protein CIH43_14485 [Salmonella enterica]|uniref:Uncharacterized protein n=1 Tax=Salmonella enterica TaxID=28901 RepID=A0A5V5HF46_SALER|nr:hypothetical protein [Salmonella enterica]EDS6989254.1 hypothetical protein [Salmonella enterica subsp. enterica serovar Offa]EDW4570728.1 hypothetical protein [Salmonella enterica subsp. enterica]EAU6348544.1 hypothetical protein [Salmonella enterica]EAV2396964.1 hypothetical protein [Salmonella enterica]
MRTTDRGSTTGAASWTDRARSERAARRASAASQSPPHRHIQERARTKVRAFVSKLLVFTVIFLMKVRFLTFG